MINNKNDTLTNSNEQAELKKKVGRKKNKEITNNEMIVWIEKYTEEFPNEPINISKLAKFSRIERHYWYYREGVKQEINKINNTLYEDFEIAISSTNNRQLLELPDVDSLIENNYSNKKKLKQLISNYFNIIQEFYESACQKYNIEKQYDKVVINISKLEKQLSKEIDKRKEAERLMEYYKGQSKIETVKTSDANYRSENHIKENKIELEKGKVLSLTTDTKALDKLIENFRIE